MRAIVFFVSLMCTMLIGLYPTAVDAKEWRLALCHGKDATEVDMHYRSVIAKVTAGVFRTADKKAQTKLKARECVVEPDIACYGVKEAIFCREEPLAMIVRMAAWLAAESAFIYTGSEGNKSALEERPQLGWVDALLLADSESAVDNALFIQRNEEILQKRALSQQSLAAIYAVVIDLYRHTNNDSNEKPDNSVLINALKLYNSITHYAFSFIMGHEAYHFGGNNCPIDGIAKIESKGHWNEMVALQLKKGLYDPQNLLDEDELLADLCGYRWLEVTASELANKLDPVMNAMSKRLAIDLLAGPILAGLRIKFSKNEFGAMVPRIKFASGYLYPQSRMILAASSLRMSEKHYPEIVKICNDTGKAMVTIVQSAVSNYPKSTGHVPDSILAEMAPGIEKSWNGQPWTDDSYRCMLETKK